ncbi:MAG: maltose ABC transporter substrate-binding protein [Treponema sp.]|nr:maltose ABC transporter substrate-binding protein [Treponema sp.]
MKKIITFVLTGAGALICIALAITGMSALGIRNAWNAAEARRIEDLANEGHTAGNLLVWLDNKDWADAVLSAFKKHYPEVNVRYETVGNVDTRGKVSLDGPAGIGPDVFLMPHDHIGNAIIDDICLPFPPDMQKKYSDLLISSSVKTCTFDGDLYAVPISTENIAFFYNIDLLGETPVPQSFEEIIAFSQAWNIPAQSKYALRWQVSNSYINYFFLSAFGMELFGPDMDDFRQPGFDSPAARSGVAFHNSLQRYFNVKTADATDDFTIAAFQRGEVPFTISGPWLIGEAKNNRINFGVSKLPTINGRQPRCFSGNIVAAVSSYSKNAKAAYAFVDFLASIEGATVQFKLTGKLAAHKDISAIEGLKDDVYLQGIMEQAPFSDPMPVIPEVNQMWDAMAALFTFTWDGQLSIEAAQEKAMETYDTSLLMAGKSRSWAE